MAQTAGGVSINLTLNTATYTKGLTQAQREMSRFVSGTRQGMHGTVTDVQSVSASLRALNGGFQNNLRSMERWVAQSKTATAVAKTMFPIVGAGTFAFLLAGMVGKVADFIKTANQMPKAIQMGFASLQLASQSSTDALRLTNDQLQNSINKLEGKPVNNLAIQFDESAKAADKLASSIENSSSRLNTLLSSNHLSGWALLTGKMGTADRQGTIKAFGDQQDSNANDLATATSSGDSAGITKARAALKATQEAELANLKGDLANRQANSKNPGALNDSANINIDKGAITAILNQQKEEAEEVRNAKLSAQKQSLDDAKAAGEAAKKAAHDRVEAMQAGLDSMKLQYNMSIKATYDYWELKKSTELAGGTAYNDIVKKQSELAVQAATQAHEKILKAIADAKLRGAEDATTGPALINSSNRFMQGQAVKDGGDQTQGYIDINHLAIDKASNDAREQEAKLTDEAGKSMSRYAAAIELANVHAQEFKTTQAALQAILDARKAAQSANPSKENGQAVTSAQTALDNANSQRGMQITRDANLANPPATSMNAGFSDAINDFVNASRDGAEQMRGLVTNTLQGLNQQILGAMSGQHTSFRNFGAGVFRNVAGTALEKGEGSILSAFGGGKLGSTAASAMWVRMANSGVVSGVSSAASSVISKTGGVGGVLGGLLKSVLPGFANGTSYMNGPAIVGERGPELFVPSSGGAIIPNNKLTSSGSTGAPGHTFNIDARGSNDPAQTEAAIHRAMGQYAPHIIAASVKATHEHSARRPASARH